MAAAALAAAPDETAATATMPITPTIQLRKAPMVPSSPPPRSWKVSLSGEIVRPSLI